MNTEDNQDALTRLQVLEDIESIRKLKAAYCAACDDDHNPTTLGTLFTQDAVWEASTMGRAEGRAAIQKLLGDLGKSGVIRNSAHNVFNPVIEVAGDRASGHWRLLMLYTGKHPNGDLHHSRIIGWYRDTYVKIDGRWQFNSLYCEVEEAAAYALAPTDV